jgi:hypothetical protein
MAGAGPTRVLAIMGSGETSPTMVTVHKTLAARLGGGEHKAVLLDTPYAFQENAADISARSAGYFARSVGLTVDVVSDADPAELAAIRSADWLFAGPGSPSYALRRWRGSPVPDALRERIAAGTGLTVIASAAAAAIGFAAVPVYEIYKVGADPHWLEGLDLMGVLGLKVAVIPHYDNAEGGTHDTRFCYLGERRLAMLEPELPADAAVLGVDEHTALVLDLLAEEAEVLGRGGVTVRKKGVSTVFGSGSRLSLQELRDLVRTGTGASLANPARPASPAPSAAAPKADLSAVELPEITRSAEIRFAAAEREKNGTEMVAAILDLESAIQAWSTDTDQNDNADLARAVLRGLIVRLGRRAERGLADPADQFKPAIDPLISLRDSLRRDGGYAAADTIRDALAAAGIEIQDSPDGTIWRICEPGPS